MKQVARSVGLACILIVAPMAFIGCAHDGEHRTAGTTIDDATITAKVKSQLLADPAVSGLNVNVTTNSGQVQLSGYVDSQEQRTKAEQVAKAVDGVKTVSNDLIVKTQ
ncbi:MAG: BON domain-containing protein [Gammaproteobacteria bacterium]|nr:BON domain-containing protein [Gammaproteobacteria bacterium]